MQVYQGKSVYEGIAIGRIQIYQKKERQVKPYYVADVTGERRRLEAAIAGRLAKLHEKMMNI